MASHLEPTELPDAQLRTTLPPASAGQVRSARRLLQRKFRQQEGAFLVEGPQAVRECASTCETIFVTPAAAQRYPEILNTALDANVAVYRTQDVSGLSDSVTPQGIVGVHRLIASDLASDALTGHSLVVIGAQVRDPGNAGTLIRCADAFGAGAIIFTVASVDVHNPKTVRASVGSIFHLPVITGVTLADAAAACRAAQMQILAADGVGERDLDQLRDAGQLRKPTAWLMGNEAWGLPDADRAAADEVVRVPMWGQAESLNLSTAAAVCLYATGSAQRN